MDRPPRKRKEPIIPCRGACLLDIDVPRYIRLIGERRFGEAIDVIRERLPFPSVLGRVCLHPCEEECRRGQLNEPISICALKRFVAEQAEPLRKARAEFSPPTGKRVAIVGSGPAGLTAAFYLARLGHSVTVFDSLPEPGGMMRVGIPDYRLPKDVLRREIDHILEQGVEVKPNTSLDSDLTLHDLKKQGYDSILIATGAHKGRPLTLEGVDLDGVLQGVDFLRDRALGRIASDSLEGKRIAIIGGGNVAIDAARTSLRLGAREVQLACLESREEMPAHEWEIEDAIKEGVILSCSWGPKRILGDHGGVTGVELVRCRSVFDEEGRFSPSFDETVKTYFQADRVIIAIGQTSDLSFLGEGSGVKSSFGETIKVDDVTLETDAEGVFAAGEVVSGPASVVAAIAAGRKAVMAIDKYLGGEGIIDETSAEVEKPSGWLGREDGFVDRRRAPMPCLPVEQRLRSFAEVELGFDEETAVEEAKRCLRCDLRLQIQSVMLPPEPWLEFNAHNVSAVPEKEGVYQLLDERKAIIYIAGTANLRQDLEEQLATSEPCISKARYFGYEESSMYTMRESELIQRFLQEHGRMPEGNEESLF